MMKKDKQKKLCKKIYKFAIENDACETVDEFKKYVYEEDYYNAIHLANSERCWLSKKGFKQKHLDKISRFCGGEHCYKLWHDNGQIWRDSKSEYCYKEWYRSGQIFKDSKSKNCDKMWHDNGQIWRDSKSEYCYKKWYENGQIFKDSKSQNCYKIWDRDGNLIAEVNDDR